MAIVKKLYSFLAFTVVLALLPLALIYTGHGNWVIPGFWLLFAFVGGLTFAALVAVLLSQNGPPETYTQIFMAATVFKLLASLVFVLFYAANNVVDKPVFMVNFIYLYFLNTGFEIYVLLRNLRNQNLK